MPAITFAQLQAFEGKRIARAHRGWASRLRLFRCTGSGSCTERLASGCSIVRGKSLRSRARRSSSAACASATCCFGSSCVDRIPRSRLTSACSRRRARRVERE